MIDLDAISQAHRLVSSTTKIGRIDAADCASAAGRSSSRRHGQAAAARNAHKFALSPINKGNAVLALYGFNPNGDAAADNGTNNTAVYGMVLGPNCEQLSKQTLLVANTNDNLGGLSDHDLIHIPDATNPNVEDVVFGLIGNGNGDDNGWYANVSATYTGGSGTAAYTLKQNFKQTVVQNEERSRMTLVPHPTDPTLALAIYAEGNSQPPNNGVRLSLVHIDKNFTAQGIDENSASSARVVWRQYLMQRQGNIYYASPSITSVNDATGKPTGKYVATYTMVDTTNRSGRQKGRTGIYTVPIQISDTGFTMLDQPKTGLFGLADGAHPGMVEGTYNGKSVAFMFQGSITDGGSAALKIIGMDDSGTKLNPVKALNWADTTSGGYTSQWYGENPNTPQGRTYPPHGIILDNPGYGVTGGYQSSVSKFLMVAHSHHIDHTGECTSTSATPADPTKGTNNGTCGGKNATSMVLIPVNADATSDPNQGNDPTTGSGSGAPVQTEGDSSQTLGGCSTTGTGGAGSLLLIGLAVASTIRRRRK